MTAIAKALGFTGSSSVLKKIEAICPDIKDRLAINAPSKDTTSEANTKVGKKATKVASEKKTVAAPQGSSAKDEGERLCPYRTGSKYSAIWLALWQHRKTGVTRKVLIEEITSSNPEMSDPKTCDFALTVVASPTLDGSAHRSADKAADFYWVEKGAGGFLKLHLRERKA